MTDEIKQLTRFLIAAMEVGSDDETSETNALCPPNFGMIDLNMQTGDTIVRMLDDKGATLRRYKLDLILTAI